MSEHTKQPSEGGLHSPDTGHEAEFEAIENSDSFDDNDSDSDWMSETSKFADSDSTGSPINMRLERPTEYFHELDTLGSRVLGNSMFQFHHRGETYRPFDGHFHLKAGHGGKASLRSSSEDDIKRFYRNVLEVANEAVSQTASEREHYSARSGLDRAIENMWHLIECRNIILWVVESVESMEAASYCGTSISILVMDQPSRDVARLLPIQCAKIKQLATAFETCLSLLISLDPSTVLVDTDLTFGLEISSICREVLSDLGLDISAKHCTDIWQCAVHILDMAVLSYAGAHTLFFGESELKRINLPGPFLEKQYFMLRRRSFLCLKQFLGGQEAWTLEWYRPDAPLHDLPPLYLSTDAATFSDIWGPMWKTCASRNDQVDYDHVLHYSVGNGVIIPWSLPSADSQHAITPQKQEIFCHWISDKEISELDNFHESSPVSLHHDSILLIGAVVKLHRSQNCNLSISKVMQRLRDDGALSELGTVRNTREVIVKTIQTQVGPPGVKFGAQLTYKRRGRPWKDVVVEDWKNNPETRNVRILENKFGVEVSSCTFNARRRRLVTLLGSNTILNYLRNGSLSWSDTECEAKFYAALEDPNPKAFRSLYQSHKPWQNDLGKAITHCLDVLMETGSKEDGIDLLWVPGSKQGQRVRIRYHEHTWANFLKNTEDCFAMAILEDNCLELSANANLINVRQCRNPKMDPARGTASTPSQINKMSVLETSFILNENAVPPNMRREPCQKTPDGPAPRHSHRWSISSIEAKQKFSFGEKGKLKFIQPLGSGRILANWKPSWDPLEIIKETFGSNDHENRHREDIKYENESGGTRPINVVIISSAPEIADTASGTVRTLPSMRLGLNAPSVHQYSWVPSRLARPRNSMGSVNGANGATSEIMGRWMRGEPATLPASEWHGFREMIAGLVASLPLPESTTRDELERYQRRTR